MSVIEETATRSQQQLQLSFGPPTITACGDGSFRLTPGRPIREMRPQQAAKWLGVCKTTVYQWLQEGRLPFRRPSPGVIWIPMEALETHRQRTTNDPEFWAQGEALTQLHKS